MNRIIEILNQWGGRWVEFAWPMLWQSSLLILMVLAVDWALARRLRASVRHALWLVVLVKLLLPPTLALPTGVAWWLTPTRVAEKVTQNYKVTYSDGVMPMGFAKTTVPMPQPRSRLSGAGWALLGSMAVSAGLLGWLLYRWVQAAGMVRRAVGATELDEALAEARRLTGLRARVRLKLVEGRLSPAVCGLFRPVILLPRPLAERLGAGQLRAVLLHELIHLRRADIWVNCAQALLQILYWWHPLVWLANGRMRRVREEAVDDAVMVALREDAEMYAPTLLEVAKLALHRPLLSLGLVGIMESRSALRQRIERLMDFRAPRKAGLTVVSVLGVLAFSAVALPMGGAPGQVDGPALPMINPADGLPESKTNVAQILITANFYDASPGDFQKYFANLGLKKSSTGRELAWTASPGDFNRQRKNLKSSGLKSVVAPRIVTVSGEPATLNMGDGANGFSLECTPVVVNGSVQLEVVCENRESNGSEPVTINRFTGNLRVDDNGGIVLMPASWNSPASNNINPHVLVLGVEIVTNAPASRNDNAGVNQLFTRALQMNPALFPAALHRLVQDKLKASGQDQPMMEDVGTNVSLEIRELCRLAGVDLKSPPKKSVVYNTNGLVFLKLTQADFNRVDKVLRELDQGNPQMQLPPQIHIKAWFYEVPKGTLAGFSQFMNASNNADGGITGILTPDNFRTVRKALQAREGIELLAEPEVVTTTGRQSQMRATQVQTLVTGMTNKVVIANNSHTNNVSPITEKAEFGPVIDVVPYVLSDDHTISMYADASLIEFFGYAQPPKEMTPQWVTNSFDEHIPLAVILPAVRVKRSAAQVEFQDNQTLVMSLSQSRQVSYGEQDTNHQAVVAEFIQDEEKKTKEKEILVFVTATMVDPAGNRVHEDYYDDPARHGGDQY